MKRTLFGLVTVLLALGLVVSCAGPEFDIDAIARKSAAWDPDNNAIGWADMEDTAGHDITAEWGNSSKRAGKIPSNAHSAEFDEYGIIFIWNYKQKDEGLLRVAKNAWDKIYDIVLVAQNSSKYTAYPIEAEDGVPFEYEDVDYYLYKIPYVGGKNINQVWLQFEVKDECACEGCDCCGGKEPGTECGPKCKLHKLPDCNCCKCDRTKVCERDGCNGCKDPNHFTGGWHHKGDGCKKCDCDDPCNDALVSAGSDSITARNAGVERLVPNSNHFNYAVLDRDELAEGAVVKLDLVAGNKQEKVGEATVTLVDGELVIWFDAKTVGSFCAVASGVAFNPKNGNVHSDYSHDSPYKLSVPAGDGDIYLYIHIAKDMKFWKPFKW